MPAFARKAISSRSGCRLDRLDLKILASLQTDGRMTNLKLAEAVGLSPTPCLQRVKRLEAAGYLKGYGAQIDFAMLGSHVTVFAEINLRDHRRENFAQFEQAVKNSPYVVSCYFISGGHDYLVQFVARDVAHYQQMMEDLIDRPLGIERFFSYIMLKQVKTSIFPIELFATSAA
jgi:DNA-binding Lrp family transcriptional regulator